MQYAVIEGKEIPVYVRLWRADPEWNRRESAELRMELSHGEADALFRDNVSWSLKTVPEKTEETLTQKMDDYSVAGSITDLRNGTLIVKMGKPTAEELLAVLQGEA